MDGARRSTSNRVDIQTSTSVPPVTVIADYATLGAGNTIDLSFTVIGSSGSSQLILTRSNVQNGPFTQIADFNTSDTLIRFTDGVSFTSDYYFYRMEGLNNCLQPSSLSNTASNIILNGSLTGTVVSLSWNEYQYWLGGVDQYRVIRTSGRNNPVIDTIDVRRNNFYGEDLGVRVNYPDPVSSLICYQIDARELTNIYGTRAMSLSNRICLSVNPDIRMPNAFIPNDADATNQVFEPVFSFEPEHYEMIIYNRLGTKIWEGSTPWDGTVNGKFVPEGVYLYYLRVYNYSTDFTTVEGKVTVVYR
jgi:gliding motility-associated-like protein